MRAAAPLENDDQGTLFTSRATGGITAPGTSAPVPPAPRRYLDVPKADQLPAEIERKRQRDRLKELLLPTVLRKGRGRAAAGFIADDVRYWAITAGVITGHERDQRAHSWMGPWLKGLAGKVGPLKVLRHFEGGPAITRASDRPDAHGNKQVVYVVVGA